MTGRRRASLALPLAVCLLAGFLLSGCGELPRPFAGGDPDNALLTLRDGAGVYVAPLTGEAPQQADELTEAMAAAIRDLEIPASATSASRGNYSLRGHATRQDAAPPGRLQIVWELRDPAGAVVMVRRSGGLPLLGAAASAPPVLDPAALTRPAAEVAPAVAELLREPELVGPALHGFPRARLVVMPLADAPEGSGPALAEALASELRQAGLPVAEEAAPDDLLIVGSVTVARPDPDRSRVSLSWSVMRANDGSPIGQIAQENDVPAAALEGGWNRLSPEIARNAVLGIRDLLDQAGRQADRAATADGAAQ